jgi:hypothetical protein
LAFKQYVRHIESDIKTDPKKLWSYIQVKNKKTRIPNVLYDIVGHEFDDPPSVVNAFCSYFSSFYIKSDSSNTLEVDLANFNNLHIPLFMKDDIAVAIKKLKDKPTAGTDQVPSFVVKDCGSAFTEPLFIMFNLILKCSVFPESWKESRIFPVLKKGDPSLINNYRPISILSNLSKVFEMILYKYIYDFAKQRIDTTQHGFMRGRSTITNLACFSQFLSKCLDNNSQVDVIYTDFDCIDHYVLIQKLSNFGFSNSLVNLFKSYLVSRTHLVEYRARAIAIIIVDSMARIIIIYAICRSFNWKLKIIFQNVGSNLVMPTSGVYCRYHYLFFWPPS